MNLVELKNQLALDAVKIIFTNKLDCIFIGGTALNAFYVDYRFSEDADIGYESRNPIRDIVGLLGKCGYTVKPTIHPFRHIIESQGVSIKLDVLKYTAKGHGYATMQLGPVAVKTLSVEEFVLDKCICFLSREDFGGLARDGFDLFMLDRKYGNVAKIIGHSKKLISGSVNVAQHNINLFLSDSEKAYAEIKPYLKKEIDLAGARKLIKKIGVILDGQ